jgi:nitrogen fixation protein NifQ
VPPLNLFKINHLGVFVANALSGMKALKQGCRADAVRSVTKPTWPCGAGHAVLSVRLLRVMAWLLRYLLRESLRPSFLEAATMNALDAIHLSEQFSGTALLDEELADLQALLLEHASHAGVLSSYLARALAVACMGPNHLWQDLGLGDRSQLNALMREYFTALHDKNHQNMRWKKFFYRQLCERADILICKSPHCEQCEDQALCFASESS